MNDAVYLAVAQISDVPEGKVLKIEVNGRPILLCHSQDDIYAIDAVCSHAEESLECGRMRGGWIACPTHGARFDLATGEPMNPPATKPIATFPLRINGDTIEISV